MIKKTVTPGNIKKQLVGKDEKFRELACINKILSIIKEGKAVSETLQMVCQSLPNYCQYPEFTACKIQLNDQPFTSPDYSETKWTLSKTFKTIDNKTGKIDIRYLAQFTLQDEGPFLKEERHMVDYIANILTGYLNSIAGRKASIQKNIDKSTFPLKDTRDSIQPFSKNLLHQFLFRHDSNRDIYHDMMPFKVKDILLVATLYDAFSIEKEGRFSEHVLGEYHQLNLTSIPRITGVSGINEAIDLLRSKHFDLVIVMMGADKKTPVLLSKAIKNEFNYIPVYLLLNNNNDIAHLKESKISLKNIDKTFVWNGDSKVFFAMVKSIEDRINLENDTKLGMVGVILLVEDSVKYYSRYLPMLFQLVMEQTQRLIEEVNTDELFKVLRYRARPKIILTSTYEEAMDIFQRYKYNILCLITDMKFEKDGILVENAGELLVNNFRKELIDVPAIIQSSDNNNRKIAEQLNVSFIDKNADRLIKDLKKFIKQYLGFGDFIFVNKKGDEISRAQSFKEFEEQMAIIPDESLIYHSRNNHFSQWVMARGEIHIAKIIHPIQISDFTSPDALRNFLCNIIRNFRNDTDRGKLIPFDSSALLQETNVVSLSSGAIGGKGRGLAFIHSLIYNFDFSEYADDIVIKVPKTTIVGTDEYEQFVQRGNLLEKAYSADSYSTIQKAFISAELSEDLQSKLRLFLTQIDKPLAVRSSGLFEDSLMQPFAGIFETYLLPNNHTDTEVRLEQLMNAIKLVYASVFSKMAKDYIVAINYKIEEERMAVVIQEVVGNRYGDVYYPHISGVAQSFNFYPFSHMKPDEGFAVAAVGLGHYVVDGGKAYRFSPKYPQLDINSTEDQYLNSQLEFIALNMSKSKVNLLEGENASLVQLEISEAEKHGTLKHCASVYDADNQRIIPGITTNGPRIINFANILKYNYISLAKVLEVLLGVLKEAMGTPVEIEFAVDLNKDKNGKASFYLLQIKPLLGSKEEYTFEMSDFSREEIILYSEKGMGNGVIDTITDVIYADPEVFDKSDTDTMVLEIENLNEKMKKMGRKYILIGPGRWGTRDKFIGIPVTWTQISNAKIIVETSLKDLPLDASLGSHFFHNVTSMNVGYFSIQHTMSGSFIQYDKLDALTPINTTKYFKHVCYDHPLVVKMDGKRRISVITFSEQKEN